VNEYRAYTVSSDAHFIGFEPLACADDAEAIAELDSWLMVTTRSRFGAVPDWYSA
jgi:hypothetical protein